MSQGSVQRNQVRGSGTFSSGRECCNECVWCRPGDRFIQRQMFSVRVKSQPCHASPVQTNVGQIPIPPYGNGEGLHPAWDREGSGGGIHPRHIIDSIGLEIMYLLMLINKAMRSISTSLPLFSLELLLRPAILPFLDITVELVIINTVRYSKDNDQT